MCWEKQRCSVRSGEEPLLADAKRGPMMCDIGAEAVLCTCRHEPSSMYATRVKLDLYRGTSGMAFVVFVEHKVRVLLR